MEGGPWASLAYLGANKQSRAQSLTEIDAELFESSLESISNGVRNSLPPSSEADGETPTETTIPPPFTPEQQEWILQLVAQRTVC